MTVTPTGQGMGKREGCSCCCLDAYLCLTLYNPVDCSPPGSSVHGISQARVLEWVAHALLQGIFLNQGLNLCLLKFLHCRQILYPKAMGEALVPFLLFF